MLERCVNESNDLSRRLRALRQQRGMSLRLLGQKVGVTGPCVFKWEQDNAKPRKHNIDALAKALSVTPEYLVTGADRDTWGKQSRRRPNW